MYTKYITEGEEKRNEESQKRKKSNPGSMKCNYNDLQYTTKEELYNVKGQAVLGLL